MIHKGIVTHVDPDLYYYTVDCKYAIYPILQLISQPRSQRLHIPLNKIPLPKRGSEIKIKFKCTGSCDLIRNKYYLCFHTEVQLSKVQLLNRNLYYDYVEQILVQNKHLKLIFINADTYLKTLNTRFFSLLVSSGSKIALLVKLLEVLHNNKVSNASQVLCGLNNPDDNDIKPFLTAKDCVTSEIRGDILQGYPDWTHNMYQQKFIGRILFGLVTVLQTLGCLLLKDDHYQIVIQICSENNHNLFQLIDNFVLITKCRLFTEIYKNATGIIVKKLEYLLVDFSDIKVVKSPNFPAKPIRFYDRCLDQSTLGFRSDEQPIEWIDFKILNKSEVKIGPKSKEPECWLHIGVYAASTVDINIFGKEKMCFLVLPKEYIKIVPVLRYGHCFRLFYQESFVEEQIEPLSRFKYGLKCFRIGTECYFSDNPPADNANFTEVMERYQSSKTLTVAECKRFVVGPREVPCTVEGVLHFKTFHKKFGQPTILSNLAEFGTPGPQTHSITFSTRTPPLGYIDCYLNDYENTAMPIGLLPQMRIRLRNAVPQSRKYLKCGAMTTFEIIGYEPIVDYESALPGSEWGGNFHLSLGMDLPYSATVWGRVKVDAIYDFCINSCCATCQHVCSYLGDCVRCGGVDRTMTCFIVLHVADMYGEVKVLITDLQFLKLMFRLNNKTYENMLLAFRELGTYNFNIGSDFHGDWSRCALRERFSKTLTWKMLMLNRQRSLWVLDMKCRKISSKKGAKMWMCMEYRRVPTTVTP